MVIRTLLALMLVSTPAMAIDLSTYQKKTMTYDRYWPICRGKKEMMPQCVTDGDTIRHGYISYRIGELDTPESDGKCIPEREKAAQAKKMTQDLLNGAASYSIVVFIDPLTYEVVRDKYGRILAEIKADGVDIATALKKANLARDYDGGTKSSWCN